MLDRNHSHFILVQNPNKKGFGGEIDFRRQLESKLHLKPIPLILIVVNGGSGTIETIIGSLEAKVPVLLIAVCLIFKSKLYSNY